MKLVIRFDEFTTIDEAAQVFEKLNDPCICDAGWEY